MKNLDYYDFLQISPHAEADTIHRVFRFLAARLHPDNPESGDPEKFHLLKTAYDVLSNPTLRADYDLTRENEVHQPVPLSNSIDFMDSVEGELNRRLALLALLYFRRRAYPWSPEVTLTEVETRMGFPRDYLEFTTWYLQKKGYIIRADNSDFTLTADGLDFVETQRVNIPTLNKLLTSGIGPSTTNSVATSNAFNPATTPIIVPPPMTHPAERRANKSDRRVNLPDRRVSTRDRRAQ